MKSVFDLKHNIGKVNPENLDDLWILSEIIIPGDLVTAKTLRGVEVRRGEEKEKVGRKLVILKIRVEKIELSERLRLSGKIVEGPSDIERGYHTIEVEPNTFLTVEREWKKWEIDKIKSASKKPEPILICILDETEADFYFLKERSEHLLHLTCKGLGKGNGISKKPEYYGNIISELKNKEKDMKKIIIAGPGFAKEEISKLIKEKAKELKEKIIVDTVSHTQDLGLQELLRRGVIERIIFTSRISEETAVVEKLLEEIAKDGKAVYGLEQIKQALESGAVEILLISDKKVREFEYILENAEKMKSKVMIISSKHASGEKLYGLGGIAALLRYKI